jgi:hypothetical protein
MGLNLDAWWDEPEYKPCNTFHLRGRFIPRKLYEHDHAKLDDVVADLYRDDVPDPQDIGTFEWQTILAYIAASEEEIKERRPSRSSASRAPGSVLFILVLGEARRLLGAATSSRATRAALAGSRSDGTGRTGRSCHGTTTGLSWGPRSGDAGRGGSLRSWRSSPTRIADTRLSRGGRGIDLDG